MNHHSLLDTDFLPKQAMVHLLKADDLDLPEAESSLSPLELARASKFRFETDRVRWIGWRAQMRGVLGGYLGLPASDVPLCADRLGKPCLTPPYQDWHFNLSHAQAWAALVVGRSGPLGIDLEPVVRHESLSECVDEVCHPIEVQKLPSDTAEREIALLHLWTAKEAALKALGLGLTLPPRMLWLNQGIPASDLVVPGLDKLRCFHPEAPPGHVMALALPHDLHEVKIADRRLMIDRAAACFQIDPSSLP